MTKRDRGVCQPVTIQPTHIGKLVHLLPERKARELLREASRRHPDIAQLLLSAAAAKAHPSEIAQLAEEAAEAVHLLDALPPAEQAARVDLVVASVTKVIRKAERYTGGGHGGRALEALVAIAEEIVRPEELPVEVWQEIAGGSTLSDLAFAMERAVAAAGPEECVAAKSDVFDLENVLHAHGYGNLFADVATALRTRTLSRRSCGM